MCVLQYSASQKVWTHFPIHVSKLLPDTMFVHSFYISSSISSWQVSQVTSRRILLFALIFPDPIKRTCDLFLAVTHQSCITALDGYKTISHLFCCI